MNILTSPWPWWVSGILIGLVVPALLILGGKTFGISSNLRHICAACLPAGLPFFNYDWKKESWNFWFVGGILIGAAIAAFWLRNPEPIQISAGLTADLAEKGISTDGFLNPTDLFSWASLGTVRGFFMIVVGGFLVGFGTRWAGGCTSGHAIMGLSNLQWPSLVATVCFMIGGFLATWFLMPLILSL